MTKPKLEEVVTCGLCNQSYLKKSQAAMHEPPCLCGGKHAPCQHGRKT